MKKTLIIVIVFAVIVGIGIYFATQDGKPVVSNSFSSVPQQTQLLNNMNQAGLAVLSAEGSVMHIHQHLDIVVNGQNIEVPSHLGIGSSFISPLHTHDTTGIVHVESPEQKDFKLGQFFKQWGVDLTDTCVATYCADDGHKLIVAVNGSPITNPAEHVLAPHEEIEVWYGAKDENPTFIKEYKFPEGL